MIKGGHSVWHERVTRLSARLISDRVTSLKTWANASESCRVSCWLWLQSSRSQFLGTRPLQSLAISDTCVGSLGWCIDKRWSHGQVLDSLPTFEKSKGTGSGWRASKYSQFLGTRPPLSLAMSYACVSSLGRCRASNIHQRSRDKRGFATGEALVVPFLATLVALHFTPVSQLVGRSFELA